MIKTNLRPGVFSPCKDERGKKERLIHFSSLFELNATWTEHERLEDAVANMMCLPVTHGESVSLVKVGSQILNAVFLCLMFIYNLA